MDADVQDMYIEKVDDYRRPTQHEFVGEWRDIDVTEETIEDMQHIQSDTYSAAAGELRPFLLEIEPENDLQAEALACVEAWDLEFEKDSVGASVFETWCWFLIRNTVADEYGDFVDDLDTKDWVKQVLMMVDLLADAESPWFDNTYTRSVRETRDDIASRSLAEAVLWLSEPHGEDPGAWEWGRVQTMTLRHNPLGYTSGVEHLEDIAGSEAMGCILDNPTVARIVNTAIENALNSEAIPVVGNLLSANAADYVISDPFEVWYGSVLRMVVDGSDWDNAVAVLVPGQSGHLLHPHREDQISLWQNHEHRPMLFSRDATQKNAKATLTLIPQQ
jgi:penicillin amidase